MATVREQFDGNTDKIDKAILDLKRELPQRAGQYVWEKLTAIGGEFIEYVTADNRDSYPENGTQDGYYYELVENIPYEGDNPLTIGASGYTFPAKTLFEEELQIINGVNGEDLTDTAADQTTAVEELMKMVNRKIAMNNGEGQYVWKKYNADWITVTNPIITVNGNVANPTVTSSDFDLDLVDESFFDGFAYTGAPTTFYYEYTGGVLYYVSTGTKYVTTYDPSTHTLTTTTNGTDLGSHSNATFTHTGDKIVGKNFIDYVVGNDATDYPNDSKLDGYWYELVEEGLPIELIGCSKMAIDTITPSSLINFANSSINHSLGEIPQKVFIHTDEAFSATMGGYWCIVDAFYMLSHLKSTDCVYAVNALTNGTNKAATGYNKEKVSFTATSIQPLFGCLEAGVTYTVITMA